MLFAHPVQAIVSPAFRQSGCLYFAFTSSLSSRAPPSIFFRASRPYSSRMNGQSASNSNGIQDVDLESLDYDPLQLEMMKEELVVVDYNDKPIGKESKKTC